MPSSDHYYKFLPTESALCVLQTKQLKVTRLTELNDIFDCCPIIKAPASKFPEYSNAEWTKRIIRRSELHVGVVCLSKTYRSPLMWAHYASSATGIALAFDFSTETSKAAGWGSPTKVKYELNRPVLQWPEDESASEFQKQFQEKHFHTKSMEWKYEDEARFVLLLKHCQLLEGKYFAPFPDQALRQVILGYKSSLDRGYLQRLLHRQFPNCPINIQLALPHSERFEFKLEELPEDDLISDVD